MENKKVIFICTGNVFRSMSAELLMKRYIEENNIEGIEVSSAGTRAGPTDHPWPVTLDHIEKYGCNPKNHKKRKISKAILDGQDLIVCMAKHHKKAVEALGFKAVLFKELSEGRSEDLLDEFEFGQLNGFDFDTDDYIRHMIDYIHDMMPKVVENIRL